MDSLFEDEAKVMAHCEDLSQLTVTKIQLIHFLVAVFIPSCEIHLKLDCLLSSTKLFVFSDLLNFLNVLPNYLSQLGDWLSQVQGHSPHNVRANEDVADRYKHEVGQPPEEDLFN